MLSSTLIEMNYYGEKCVIKLANKIFYVDAFHFINLDMVGVITYKNMLKAKINLASTLKLPK